MDGKVLGSYEIFADAPETVAAFAERAITRLQTVVETCDVVGDPRLHDRDYLVEMTKMRNTLFSRSTCEGNCPTGAFFDSGVISC